MIERFADARAAGRALAPLVHSWLSTSGSPGPTVLLAPLPTEGLIDPVIEATGLPAIGVIVTTGSADVSCALSRPADREAVVRAGTVVVLDRGVETGRRALGVASAVRAWCRSTTAAATDVLDDHPLPVLVLGVGVCPRQAQPALTAVYQTVIAVQQPLARRGLGWHYEDLPARVVGDRAENEEGLPADASDSMTSPSSVVLGRTANQRH